MLAQNWDQRDAEKGRRGEGESGSEPGSVSRRVSASPRPRFRFSSSLLFFSLSLCLCVSAVIISSCGSKPVNLQTLAPADALVYVETNDLGKVVESMTTNKPFQQLAAKKPDFFALKGIQMAVAVTGFEISEQKTAADDRALNFKPHFVAIAETHAWNYQALSFTENKLGEFINELYGGEVDLETVDKNGGRFFTWTARDGRKAFALVVESRIFFGNDESAIEKCLAVKRGEADSFAKNSKLQPPAGDTIASGYVSTDGIAQIATLAGAVMSNRSGESEDVQKFISDVLPPLVRNTVKDVTWSASKTEQGIEDRFTFGADRQVSSVWKETLVRSGASAENLAAMLPPVPFGVTRYDLKDPRIAWRSVLLLAAKQAGETYGPLLLAFSGGLFDPYGVADGEMFLSAVGPEIVTARFDAEGEKTVVVVTVRDVEKVKKAIGSEINFGKPPEKQGSADVWKSEDGELAAAFIENKLILGDAESVAQCLAPGNGANFTANEVFPRFSVSDAVAVTYGRDTESAAKIVDVLSDRKSENENAETWVLTETRFNEKGIERRTISDFGLIGLVIVEVMSK
jgi:hypothetical protein